MAPYIILFLVIGPVYSCTISTPRGASFVLVIVLLIVYNFQLISTRYRKPILLQLSEIKHVMAQH